ncbi:MAG: OmpA family protein [Leptonema sp. (in: bacteria)]
MKKTIQFSLIILMLGTLTMCQSGQTTQPEEKKPTEDNTAKERSLNLFELGKDLSFVYAPYGKGWAYKDVSLDKNDFNQWYSKNKVEFLKVLDTVDVGIVLEVVGHTDESGPQEAQPELGKKGNLWYSQQRANQVCNALIQAGISKEKIRCVGVGESEHIPGIDPYDQRQRRVTFRINKK